MPIYKPSELHQLLLKIGVEPKKNLSQNFLIDQNILKKMVTTAVVVPGDLVLEIGPGPGGLTEQLLHAGAEVIAVEKDPVFANSLERLQSLGKLEIHCADIMNFPFERVLQGRGDKVKVIANLPYHLTTPILALLIVHHSLFSLLAVMVQEEVARRFVALPDSRAYSSFTLFLNFYSHPKYGFKVSRHCFYPEPSVDSAVVLFNLHPPFPVSDSEAFFKMTRTAFEQRRKMLRSSLKSLYPTHQIEKALFSLNLPPTTRPERLSLEQFATLFELCYRTTYTNF